MKFEEEAKSVGKEILDSHFTTILAHALGSAADGGAREERERIIELAREYLPAEVIKLFIDKIEEHEL